MERMEEFEWFKHIGVELSTDDEWKQTGITDWVNVGRLQGL